MESAKKTVTEDNRVAFEKYLADLDNDALFTAERQSAVKLVDNGAIVSMKIMDTEPPSKHSVKLLDKWTYAHPNPKPEELFLAKRYGLIKDPPLINRGNRLVTSDYAGYSPRPLDKAEARKMARSFMELKEDKSIDTDKLLEFIAEYGHLHERERKHSDSWRKNYDYSLSCESVDDWYECISDMQEIIEYWTKIEAGIEKPYLMFGDISDVTKSLVYEVNVQQIRGKTGKTSQILDRKKAFADDHLFSMALLAHLLQQKMASAKFYKRYKVLPNGQIIMVEIPCDLYSFMWSLVLNSILDAGENKAQIHRCRYCGKYGINTDGQRDELSRSTEVTNFGDNRWYHLNCRMAFRKREADEKKAKEEGRTRISRKKKFQLSACDIL